MSLRERLDNSVQAFCTRGHAQSLWGNPLKAMPGERVGFWGSDLRCGTREDGKACGCAVYGGHR